MRPGRKEPRLTTRCPSQAEGGCCLPKRGGKTSERIFFNRRSRRAPGMQSFSCPSPPERGPGKGRVMPHGNAPPNLPVSLVLAALLCAFAPLREMAVVAWSFLAFLAFLANLCVRPQFFLGVLCAFAPLRLRS